MRLRRLAPVVALAVLAVPLARAGAAGVVPDPVDCVSPAGDPLPGTQAWQQRDQANQWCATQRQQDEWSNPAAGQAGAENTASLYPAQALSQAGEPDRPRTGFSQWIPGATSGDPYRTPARWTDAGRGRVEDISFLASDGAKLNGHVFVPPASTPGPYPGAVI